MRSVPQPGSPAATCQSRARRGIGTARGSHRIVTQSATRLRRAARSRARSPLLDPAESAPVSALGRRRVSCRHCCQDVFGRRSLSTIASVSAYGQAGTRMEARTPVDLHRARIASSAPGAQAVDRDTVRFGVRLGDQSAPVQRLDMHRPERRDGLVVSVIGYRVVRALAQLARPDPGQFQRIQRLQPTAERARTESIVAAYPARLTPL
jgi:hypothetical protein